ncbi:MAG TPA: hypothetical protein ACFYD3_09850 [Candidatus Hypogeohydataceae bacterium YC41]
MTNFTIMLWGQGDDAVISFLRSWRVFRSITSLRLGDNFFPHVSGKAFRFYSTEEQDVDNLILLKSVMVCAGMECGIEVGKEIINLRSVELQRQFP